MAHKPQYQPQGGGGGSIAYWSNDDSGRQQKIWLLNGELRWWLTNSKQFYVGLGATAGQANIYNGLARALSKDTGYKGDIFGGGVVVGYQLPLNKCLSMDFNLGLGVTHFKYDVYTVVNKQRIFTNTGVNKNFWGPTQAGISLVWKVVK